MFPATSSTAQKIYLICTGNMEIASLLSGLAFVLVVAAAYRIAKFVRGGLAQSAALKENQMERDNEKTLSYR